ncbi:MAG: GntR family transcriptional regulator [Alkalispirochaeta sp.]
MRFEQGRSIYEQIVEYIENQVLTGERLPGDRLPSVRELAVELGVNPNTVQRSYSRLQENGLIYNQRGVGYFVADDAETQTRRIRRREFETETLPRVFETMEAVGYTVGELQDAWKAWQHQGEIS